MKHLKSLLNDERGFILVLSMITMVALTVIGLSGASNTTIEVQIAGNERHYVQAFYASEAGWQHGVQAIQEMGSPPTVIGQFNQNDPDDQENNFLVDQVGNQVLIAGETSYNYRTFFMEKLRPPPGFSGDWATFRYGSVGTGNGLRNSVHQSMAIVEKPFKVGY